MAVRSVTRRGERRLFIDIRYRDSNGKRARYRKDAEVQTLQAARAEERRILLSLAKTGSPFGVLTSNGDIVDAKPDTPEADAAPLFKDVVTEYMADYAKSQLKPSTRVGYQKMLKAFLLDEIGDLPITEITPTTVRELDAKLVDSGIKVSTRRSYQIVLRSILGRFAVERGYLSAPPPFPKLPRVGKLIHEALSDEEIARLFEATTSPEHRRAFLLAAYAGLRAGEIRALRWRDVDLKARTLTVRLSCCHGETSTPKSGHERLIPLAENLRQDLATEKRREPDALVSVSRGGEPWGEYGLRQAFDRVAERAGLSRWRFHDLRHYFVTHLFRTGAPAPTVQMLAGHADLSTTQRYAHTTRADLRAAMDRVGGNRGATPLSEAPPGG